MEHDHELDARGLLCPLPVLKAAKQLRALEAGEVLKVLTDDPAAIIDMPHYCNESGNAYLGVEETDGAQAHFVRKS